MLKKETNMESDICNIKEPAHFNFAVLRFGIWITEKKSER